MSNPLILSGSAPFFLPGKPVGCLLLHGFTSTPEEMLPLGQYLNQELDYTVLGARLAGHATHPDDLSRVRWRDWLISFEENLALLRGSTQKVVVCGLSMGGVLALLGASRYPVDAVISMSTPYALREDWRMKMMWLYSFIIPWRRKRIPLNVTDPSIRRQKDYPAYAGYPTRIVQEMNSMLKEMSSHLPEVTVPALLLQSRTDAFVEVGNAEKIYANIRSSHKQLQILEGFDHSIVQDPKRTAAFALIRTFLEETFPT